MKWLFSWVIGSSHQADTFAWSQNSTGGSITEVTAISADLIGRYHSAPGDELYKLLRALHGAQNWYADRIESAVCYVDVGESEK